MNTGCELPKASALEVPVSSGEQVLCPCSREGTEVQLALAAPFSPQAQGPQGGDHSCVPEPLLTPRVGGRQDRALTEPLRGSRAVSPSRVYRGGK